jgi:hypothetical protein
LSANPTIALINSAILACLAFFYTLIGVKISIPGTNWPELLVTCGIVAGFAFFSRLALEYGLQPQTPQKRDTEYVIPQ